MQGADATCGTSLVGGELQISPPAHDLDPNSGFFRRPTSRSPSSRDCEKLPSSSPDCFAKGKSHPLSTMPTGVKNKNRKRKGKGSLPLTASPAQVSTRSRSRSGVHSRSRSRSPCSHGSSCSIDSIDKLPIIAIKPNSFALLNATFASDPSTLPSLSGERRDNSNSNFPPPVAMDHTASVSPAINAVSKNDSNNNNSLDKDMNTTGYDFVRVNHKGCNNKKRKAPDSGPHKQVELEKTSAKKSVDTGNFPASDSTATLPPPSKKNKEASNKYRARDLPPYIVFISSLDSENGAPPHPLATSRLINTTVGKSVREIKKIGRAKLSVEFDTPEAANSVIDSPVLKGKNLVAVIPAFRVLRMGIIKDIALDFDVEELISEAESPEKILSVQRLSRRVRDPTDNKLSYLPSRTVLVKFQGQTLPSTISIYKVRHPVLPFVPRVQICYTCFRFGHFSSNCRSKARCLRCGKTKHDEKEQCPRFDISPVCANCNGEHVPTSASCPVFQRQRQIQAMASVENIPLADARARIGYGTPLQAPGGYFSAREFPSLSPAVLNEHSYSRSRPSTYSPSHSLHFADPSIQDENFWNVPGFSPQASQLSYAAAASNAPQPRASNQSRRHSPPRGPQAPTALAPPPFGVQRSHRRQVSGSSLDCPPSLYAARNSFVLAPNGRWPNYGANGCGYELPSQPMASHYLASQTRAPSYSQYPHLDPFSAPPAHRSPFPPRAASHPHPGDPAPPDGPSDPSDNYSSSLFAGDSSSSPSDETLYIRKLTDFITYMVNSIPPTLKETQLGEGLLLISNALRNLNLPR